MSRVLPAILLGLLLGARTAPAPAMSFDAAGDQLVLAGPVERGDFDRFKSIVERNRFKIDAIVLLDSPGGAAADGFMIGDLIREKRYRTIVAGACYSACALIFLGGAERYFAEGADERALLAFHGLYFRDGSLAQEVTGINRDWVMRRTERWVDDSLLRQWTRFADPRDFVYFLPAESARRRFGAAVLVCKAATDPARGRADCQRVPDTDAYREGIATSRQPARLDPRVVEGLRARR
ncbi:MAG: hypothetical protein JNK67_10995 [Alphaproteobacteria bacterium]|nr:hypothetical protein [Alphaproteobacteria bacterium]